MASRPEALFCADGRVARGLLEVSEDPAVLERGGFWAVLITFEGAITCARFADVAPGPAPAGGAWRGPRADQWRTSLDERAYRGAVAQIRDDIGAGEVYQVNLCRILSVDLPDPTQADLLTLSGLLAAANPAPHAAYLRLPGSGIEVAGASPELYLRRAGAVVESGPIKGTGRRPADLQTKDHAENVMIVDLIRNDLGRVCRPGSVSVPALCRVEAHPGLVHLVSLVRGELAAGAGWPELLAASFPPGSVSGAPKLAALEVIGRCEPAARGPYCGALGWVDADAGTAQLAVGIRTFWRAGDELCFGTGAGITWGSDPGTEWAETELKAAHLLSVAAEVQAAGVQAAGVQAAEVQSAAALGRSA
ncbi:MAG: chorismate-binding protein [Sporichthyaceae bacterium]